MTDSLSEEILTPQGRFSAGAGAARWRPRLAAALDLVAGVAPQFEDEWWIIGSAAAALAGADILDVADVDLLLSERDPAGARYVLHWAKAVRYGSFVRPGEVLRVEVVLTSAPEGSPAEFRGQGQVIRPASGSDDPPTTTVSGRFALGPCRVRVPSGNGAHAHP